MTPLSRYYLEHIDRYFSLFNVCHKARANQLVAGLLFENDLKRRHDAREINARQYAIASQILAAGHPVPLKALRRAPWYLALYTRLSDKTKQRDCAVCTNLNWFMRMSNADCGLDLSERKKRRDDRMTQLKWNSFKSRIFVIGTKSPRS